MMEKIRRAVTSVRKDGVESDWKGVCENFSGVMIVFYIVKGVWVICENSSHCMLKICTYHWE